MQVLYGTIDVESLSLSLSLFIVQLCKNLDNIVSNGRIEYLQPLGGQSGSSLEGGYPEGTMANVTCDKGYRTNGSSITCHNGNWSGEVPECSSESLSL